MPEPIHRCLLSKTARVHPHHRLHLLLQNLLCMLCIRWTYTRIMGWLAQRRLFSALQLDFAMQQTTCKSTGHVVPWVGIRRGRIRLKRGNTGNGPVESVVLNGMWQSRLRYCCAAAVAQSWKGETVSSALSMWRTAPTVELFSHVVSVLLHEIHLYSWWIRHGEIGNTQGQFHHFLSPWDMAKIDTAWTNSPRFMVQLNPKKG